MGWKSAGEKWAEKDENLVADKEVGAATATTVYCAIPSATLGSYTLKLNTNQQTNPDSWKTYVMTDTGTDYSEGVDLYSCTFTDLWDGVACMQFQLYDGETHKGQNEAFSSWTAVSNYNGKTWIYGNPGSWDVEHVDTTLEVNFTSNVPSYVNIYCPGSHVGWDNTFEKTLMTRVSNTKFTLSLSNIAVGNYQYKIIAMYSDAAEFNWKHEIDSDNVSFTISESDDNDTIVFANKTYDFATNMPEGKTVAFIRGIYQGAEANWATNIALSNPSKESITLTPGTPTTINATLELHAGDKIKFVAYYDGVAVWSGFNSIDVYDEVYYDADIDGTANLDIKADGFYVLSGSWNNTADGSDYYDFDISNTATEWANEFLNSMTCDSDGIDEPEFKTGYSWQILGEKFAALDTYARNTLQGATALKTGGTAIQEAMSRYDTIIANHGYTNFVKNTSNEVRSAVVVNYGFNTTSNNSSALIICLISITLVASLSGYLFYRNRSKQD